MFKRMRSVFSCFCHEEDGFTLPLMGVTAVVMVGFLGLSVDVGRMQLVQSRLSFALDAAGLAAGATISTTSADTEVTKYLNANFPTGFLGATAPVVSTTVSSDNLLITLKATTTLQPVIMQLFGFTTQKVQATAQITRAVSGLELVLVLDNTGSMNSDNKLTSLKSAATTLINTLFSSAATTTPNLWIGLVPFSQAVNIGTSRTGWLASTSSYNWGKTSWGGCVDARLSGNDVTDATPTTNPFVQYYWPANDVNNLWQTGTSQCLTRSWNGWSYVVKGNGTNISSTTCGPNLYCPQSLQFMTSNKTTVLNAVNSMLATGNTHINLGLVWGWRMLSPKWKTAWNSAESYNGEVLPLNYGTKHMNKAVVLLTDGQNTMDSTDRTAYWYLSDARLGTTNSTQAVTNLNTRMSQVCSSLKSNGVYVYAITLGTGTTTSVKTLMQNCASGTNYYFNSPSASDLQGIFSKISDSLSNLRVSQ